MVSHNLPPGRLDRTTEWRFFQQTFSGEADYGGYDIQWHQDGRLAFEPTIKTGGTTRPVYGTRSRSVQSSGEWVCKEGKTTGMTCGTINTTSYCYSSACTWVSVNAIADLGDSGGPWFSGNTAYGSHTASNSNTAVYMAVDYFSIIGVSVVLAPPPPPALSAGINGPTYVPYGAWCSYSGWATGGVPPYTYTWSSVMGADAESAWQNEYWVLTDMTSTPIELWLTVRDAAGQEDVVTTYVFKSQWASC